MSDEELIERLNSLFWLLEDEGYLTMASTVKFAAASIKTKAAEIERLRDERERLALAICGGEDAPGYANAQTIEMLEKVARDNHNATREQIYRTWAFENKLENLLGGAETVLEAWDHHMRDVVVPASLHDAIEELRPTLAELTGGKDAQGNM